MSDKVALTEAQKGLLYDAGHYVFPVPPVTTGYWNRHDWINYVDSCGSWGDPDKTADTIRRIHDEGDDDPCQCDICTS